jgi:cytochrome P450
METATQSYVARLDAEPNPTKLALLRQFMADDPFGLFKDLRANRPVMVIPDCVVLSLYDDIIEMFNMPKVFTAALYIPKMANGYFMMHDDDNLHYREKSIMQGLLNRDDIPKVRRMVTQICTDLLTAAGGRIDAVPGYCRLTPATIVRDYFGLVGIDRKDLMEWSYWAQVDTFYNQPFDILTPEQRQSITNSHNAAANKLGEYIKAMLLTRLLAVKFGALLTPFKKLWQLLAHKDDGEFHDDMVTRMLRCKFPKEVNFDLQRVGVNAAGLLIGTIETTAQSSVQAIGYFLDHPDVLLQARNAAGADDPAVFDSLVWEALRFVPISPYMFRQTACEYTIAKGTPRQTTIPPMTNIMAITQSAMFDEKAFESPERFLPRRNWYHYFTFGYGEHECLGKYVGMVMVPEIVRQVMRLPGLKPEGEIVYDGHMPKSYTLTWTR